MMMMMKKMTMMKVFGIMRMMMMMTKVFEKMMLHILDLDSSFVIG